MVQALTHPEVFHVVERAAEASPLTALPGVWIVAALTLACLAVSVWERLQVCRQARIT